jgi:hypothetical protein
MKQFFTLLSLLIVMGISASVMAQSTGEAPAPGATHTYSTTDNGNTYAWTVTVGDLTTPAGTDATITGSGASVSITWAPTVTVDDWYYVHVIEADGSCTNEKVLPVQITASNFYVSVAADNATACYDDPVSVSLNVNTPEYSHGDVTLTYTITPTGVNATSGGYEFDFDLNANLPAGYTAAAPTVSSGSATISGSTITVSDVNAVTLEFVVTNGNTYTNANDGSGIAADFTATLSIANGVTGNGVSDNTSGTYSADTDVTRPHTSEITTN